MRSSTRNFRPLPVAAPVVVPRGRRAATQGACARCRRAGGAVRRSAAGGVTEHAYDALGRKTSAWTGAADPAAATTRTDYAYDALGRLKVVTASRRFGQAVDADPSAPGTQPEATLYAYDAAGMLDYEMFRAAGGDVTKDFGYDAQGRVSYVRHFRDGDGDHALDAGEALLDGFAYTYLADGSRSGEAWTDSLGNVTTRAWAYDALNRLVTETYAGVDGSADALTYTDAYRFDLASNRAVLVHVGSDGLWTVKGEFDANDRLLTERRDAGSDGSVEWTTAYRYDHPNGTANGGTGQTRKTVTGDQSSTTSFAYDATGRMTGVTVDGTTVAYKYDHNGFRVTRTAGGQATVYHVDPANPTGYAQSLEEGTDANGDGRLSPAEVAAAFTLALDVVTQATRLQAVHLLSDAHGSTRAALDAATGGVAQRYAYDAYGRDLGLATPLTALRYAGEAIDPMTGLSFNRARWYDPAAGRFGRVDPWMGNSERPVTLNKGS